jgi:hypothetical protein
MVGVISCKRYVQTFEYDLNGFAVIAPILVIKAVRSVGWIVFSEGEYLSKHPYPVPSMANERVTVAAPLSSVDWEGVSFLPW